MRSLALCLYLGIYDALSHYQAVSFHSGAPPQLRNILIARYAGAVPLIILRVGLRAYHPRATLSRANAIAWLLAAIPCVLVAVISLCARAEVYLCDLPPAYARTALRPCNTAHALPPQAPLPPAAPSAAAAPPPLPIGGGGNDGSSSCYLGMVDGVGYCERSPVGYLTTMLMLHAYLPYAFTFAPRALLVAAALSSTAVSLLAVGLSAHVVHAQPTLAPTAAEWLRMVVWVLVAHLIGIFHQTSRRTDQWETSALRLRQARLLRSTREEREHCGRLLANILPPHLMKSLGAQLLAQPSKPAPPTGSTPAVDSAMGSGRVAEAAQPGLGLGVAVCESYTGCSFLFAKIGGLSQLINDEQRAPPEVMHSLQKIFDRFDALADMFGVQKVRKTANEYYLVAAGLPNPRILPTPEDRACGMASYAFAMVAIMDIVNLELATYGIHFTVQVGIHSGSAIAGVIGHKTVQYDLCGDAVNTAARMCSYSKPSHVHVSETTYQLLRGRYAAVCRGTTQVKGKGSMTTYFLLNLPADQREVTLSHDSTARGNDAGAVKPLPPAGLLPPPSHLSA